MSQQVSVLQVCLIYELLDRISYATSRSLGRDGENCNQLDDNCHQANRPCWSSCVSSLHQERGGFTQLHTLVAQESGKRPDNHRLQNHQLQGDGSLGVWCL